MVIDPEYREVGEPVVVVTMSKSQAEHVQWAIADVLCWVRGFMAGGGETAERYAPTGTDALREMNIAMKRAIEKAEEESRI